jgi:hypothetical protein
LNYSLIVFGSAGLLLLAALAWLSISKVRRNPERNADLNLPTGLDLNHVAYLPQIKQALTESDLRYLEAAGPPGLPKRVRKERQKIALDFLFALREDFRKLHHLARVIAAMSPDVAVAQELQGLRLNAAFTCRYYLIYLRLRWGIAPFDALSGLSDMFSGLTVRMEEAIRELGERAVFPEVWSSLDGGGLGAN